MAGRPRVLGAPCYSPSFERSAARPRDRSRLNSAPPLAVDPGPRRPPAQPQEPRRRLPARPPHRHHRRVGLGQVVARLRHALCRGAAALRRVGLDATRSSSSTGCRAPTWTRSSGLTPAVAIQQVAPGAQRPLDRRDRDRDLRLPAAAVRPARHRALREVRASGDRRQPGVDRPRGGGVAGRRDAAGAGAGGARRADVLGGAGRPPACTRATPGSSLDGEVVPLDPLPRLPQAGRATFDVVVDRFTWRLDQRERARGSLRAGVPPRRGPARAQARRRARPRRGASAGSARSCGTPAMRPEPALFSFNSPLGVCPTCRGFGNVLTFTPDLIVPDPSLTLRKGALRPWARSWRKVFWPRLEKLAQGARHSARRAVAQALGRAPQAADRGRTRASAARFRSSSGCRRSPTTSATGSS